MYGTMLPGRFGLFRREMDQLFHDFFGNGGAEASVSVAVPALNIWEDAQNFYVEAEVPGIKIEQIEISVAGDQFTLRGERTSDEKEGVACHRRERQFGEFTRVTRLPAAIDPSKVQATLKNGVLTITLPKSEHARPRRIEVKASN